MAEFDAGLLEKAGVTLFGDRWKGRLSQKISVSDRQIFRWIYEERPCHDTLWDGRFLPGILIELLLKHRHVVDELIENLSKYQPPSPPPSE